MVLSTGLTVQPRIFCSFGENEGEKELKDGAWARALRWACSLLRTARGGFCLLRGCGG